MGEIEGKKTDCDGAIFVDAAAVQNELLQRTEGQGRRIREADLNRVDNALHIHLAIHKENVEQIVGDGNLQWSRASMLYQLRLQFIHTPFYKLHQSECIQ